MNDFLQFFIEFVIVALIVFVLNYIQQRAIQKATKAEIGKITKKVEKIRNDFLRKSNYVQRFDDIERETIIDYYVNAYEYLKLLNTYPIFNNVSSTEFIEFFRIEVEKKQAEHDHLSGLLSLLCFDDIEIDERNFKKEIWKINNILNEARTKIFYFLTENTIKPNTGEDIVIFIAKFNDYTKTQTMPYLIELYEFGKVCRQHIKSKFPV